MFDLSLINYMNRNGLMKMNGSVEDFLRKYLKIAYSNDSGDSWNKQLKKLRLSDTNGTPKTLFKYKDLWGFTGIKQEGKKLEKRLNKVLEADGVNRNPCRNPYWELPGRMKLSGHENGIHIDGIHIGALPDLTDTMKKKICVLTDGKIEGDYLILDKTSIGEVTNILNSAGHQGYAVRYKEGKCRTEIGDGTFKLPDEITVRDTGSPGYQFSVDGKFISELNDDQNLELCVLTRDGRKGEETLSLDLEVAKQFVGALERAGHSKRAFKFHGGVKVAGCKGDYGHLAEAAQELMDVICQ